MGNRKAAYTVIISDIEPIEGKDRIKYISIKDLGWKVIGSADLKIGQKVVYIEYDCIIAEGQPWAEFLRKRCYSPKYHGFKIRAMSMAGVVSYGLILTFEEVGLTEDYPEGYDLSELLHVIPIDDAQNFENEQSSQRKMTKFQKFVKKYAYFIWKVFWYRKPENNAFPTQWANKTDETRIENFSPEVFKKWYGKPIYISVKQDGQSMSAGIVKDRFFIASRNLKKYDKPLKKAIKELTPENYSKLNKLNQNPFIYIACKYSLAKRMASVKRSLDLMDFVLQMEVCGPGIQQNKMGLKELDAFVFNFYDVQERKYFKWWKIKKISEFIGIPHVELVQTTIWKWNNLKELKDYAKGTYANGYPREGIVIRSNDGESQYIEEPEKGQHGCWSVKCINDDFALKDNS
jgi:hypothetical protein